MSNKIKKIKQKLTQIGSILPGSLREQWYTCKTKNCKCTNKNNPQKHGPYHQLSFTIDGKSSTIIIKEEDVTVVRKQIENYKGFKKLNLELAKEYLSITRKHGVEDRDK
jgi:hypothetical protein